jgi:hypothetical protein
LHRPDGRLELGKARVLERAAGRQDRLFAHDPQPTDALDFTVGVGDDPLARDELRDFGPQVGDAHVILKQVRSILWGAAVGQELALHLNPDAAGGDVARPNPANRRVGHIVDWEALEFPIMPWSLI